MLFFVLCTGRHGDPSYCELVCHLDMPFLDNFNIVLMYVDGHCGSNPSDPFSPHVNYIYNIKLLATLVLGFQAICNRRICRTSATHRMLLHKYELKFLRMRVSSHTIARTERPWNGLGNYYCERLLLQQV